MKFSKPKQTGLKFIGGAIILALVSGIGAYYTISETTAKVATLAAKAPIAKGDPLKMELFNTVYLPKGGVPQDALTPSTNLSTRISNKDMATDDVLRAVNTTDLKHESPSLLSARLRALEQIGLVGGEIPIDSIQGMLDGMKSGDKVYLVGVSKEVQASGTSGNPSNTKVVGKTIVDSAIAVGIKGTADGKPALIVATTKEDAIKVAVAREEGKLYAYLLPFGDEVNKDQ